MNFKQIADVAGCSERTVRRYARKTWPERSFTSKFGADLNEGDSVKLMALIPKRNDVATGQTTGQLSGLSERDRQLIGLVVAETVKAILPTLQLAQPQAGQNVQVALPAPSQRIIPDIPMRKQVVNLVNEYSAKHEASNFESTWTRLYREFGDRFGINVKARASHKGIKPIDWVDREGLMESLYLVAITIFSRGAA